MGLSQSASQLAASAMETAGGVLSTALSYRSARKQMEFQERMSSTSHQREVKDLIKAGLNPMLSAHGGGASTPVGAVVHPENPLKGVGDRIINALRAKNERETADTVRKLNEKALDKIESDIKTQDSQQKLNSALAAKTDSEKRRTDELLKRDQAEGDMYEKYPWIAPVEKLLEGIGRASDILTPWKPKRSFNLDKGRR